MELTFTAVDGLEWAQLDSIKVMNLTQEVDTVLYYPDTVLALDYTIGMAEIDQGAQGLEITAVYPNPTTDHCNITFQLPANGEVSIVVTDILGRVVTGTERFLQKGHHSFRLVPGGEGMYLVQLMWHGQTKSVKVLGSVLLRQAMSTLDYLGGGTEEPVQKTMEAKEGFRFSLGDDLLYTGYTETLESVIPDVPSQSQAYSFQFAYDIPCPGTPTVNYEGQVYNTVQIFSQCWLKENLNVGAMIQSTEDMSDNDLIEKYCFNDESDSCTKYGGLYQWDEMMQYVTQQGVQGICPPGWHIPSNEECKQLWGAADSQYGYPDPEWNDIGYMGYDADVNLKSVTGWNLNNNGTDSYGFKAVPGGSLHPDYGFMDAGEYSLFWTSSDSYTLNEAWFWSIDVDYGGLNRYQYNYQIGFSVRCLRDE